LFLLPADFPLESAYLTTTNDQVSSIPSPPVASLKVEIRPSNSPSISQNFKFSNSGAVFISTFFRREKFLNLNDSNDIGANNLSKCGV
jgi:hypothetical protein